MIDPQRQRHRVLGEVLAATAAVAVLLALGEALAGGGEVLAQLGGLVVAAGFVGVPLAVAHWRKGHGELLGDVLAVDPPLGRAALAGLAVAAAVLPAYALGFDLWQTAVLHKLRVAPDWLVWRSLPEQALVQLGAVALPEELFFRGYVQGRLSQVWPARRQVAGVPFGAAQVVAALLFAAVHLVAVPAPFRMLVFFPGLLFGWVAARSGSAVTAAVLHACCNLTLWVLQACYA